jgi:hypothetical protein
MKPVRLLKSYFKDFRNLDFNGKIVTKTLKNIFRKNSFTSNTNQLRKMVNKEVKKIPKKALLESAVYSGDIEFKEIIYSAKKWAGKNKLMTFIYVIIFLIILVIGKIVMSKKKKALIKRKEKQVEAKINNLEPIEANVVACYILKNMEII